MWNDFSGCTKYPYDGPIFVKSDMILDVISGVVTRVVSSEYQKCRLLILMSWLFVSFLSCVKSGVSVIP